MPHPDTPPPTTRARMEDVALATGVSLMTVSRAVNGRPWVHPDTRALVLEAADRLGYRLSRGAQTLASGAVRSVTVVTSQTGLHREAATLLGIEQAASAAGFGVGICVVDADETRVDYAMRRLDPLTGVIVLAFDLAGARALARTPDDLAVVAVMEHRPAVASRVATAWLDDQHGARLATDYLLDLGHTRVHYLPLASPYGLSPRETGWATALAERGVAPVQAESPGTTMQDGYQAGTRLAADDSVTAVLCGSDDLAIGVMRALRESGRNIPDDVSVVGFDDVPHAAFLSPALTTVRLDFRALGHECFRLLEQVLESPVRDRSVTLPRPELIVRDSAAPCARNRSPALAPLA